MQRLVAVAIVVAAVAGALAIGMARRGKDQGARCGVGFVARGARCFVEEACPAPLVANGPACDAPDVRVFVPAAAIAIGPSDWEAEGRVGAKTVRAQAFRIDAFEVTAGKWGGGATPADALRAAAGMTQAEAAAYCAKLGGRLPTEDEWIIAALSAANPPRRYPWGDTGAVCRRAAWGLLTGPCATGADGPDTVGAHADGDTPLGLHDMAGNVAEWVVDNNVASTVSGEGPRDNNLGGERPRDDAVRLAKGGSWETALASDLRIWARRELGPDARAPDVGFRCAYAP